MHDTSGPGFVTWTALAAPLWHPIKVVSTLMQLGHEPVPPHLSYSILTRRYSWYYPRTFSYTYGIIQDRGFRGLYRGFVPSVIEATVQGAVYCLSLRLAHHAVDRLLPEGEIETNVDDFSTNRNNYLYSTKAFLFLTVAGCLTEVITRPLTVITLKTIALHISQGHMYSSVLEVVRQIYNEEGIAGFYSGLVPAILWNIMSNLIHQVAWLVIEETAKLMPARSLSFLKWLLSAYMSFAYSYPLALVSTLMAVNGSGTAAVSMCFSGWQDCWNYLRVTGDLFRGVWYYRILFRYRAHAQLLTC